MKDDTATITVEYEFKQISKKDNKVEVDGELIGWFKPDKAEKVVENIKEVLESKGIEVEINE